MKHSTFHFHTEESHMCNIVVNVLKKENMGSFYGFVICMCLGIPSKSMEKWNNIPK